MANSKLTKLELQIMETFWTHGVCSIREVQEAFPDVNRPAYTTIQTTVYRLESKKALRRVRKVGNFHVFEATISRGEAQGRLIDELLRLFGDSTQPVVAHLVQSGRLTVEDVQGAMNLLEDLRDKEPKDKEER